MAQWSEKAQEQRKAERLASVITERKELFSKFRAGGWKVVAIPAAKLVSAADWYSILDANADNLPTPEVHFMVKMPGAYPARICTIAQLMRLANGVAQ